MEPTSDDLPPAPDTSTTPEDSTSPGPDYGSGFGPDEPSEDTGSSSRRGSSAPRSIVSKAQLAESIEHGVLGVSALVHDALARDELEREAGLYLADEDDARQLAKPLAGIASRRMGAAAGAASPDLADAIAAAIALAVYVAKQLRLRAHLRALRRGRVPAEQTAEQPDVGVDLSGGLS